MATEKRLIDANALMEAYLEEQKKPGIYSIAKIIMDAPTVDAVEVVRCENCIYRSQYADKNGNYKCGGILTEDEETALMVKPDFFCAYGERKDNG